MHPMLDKIDAALKAVGHAKVNAVANGDVFEAVCSEEDVTLDADTQRFATYRNVRIDRSPAWIPDDGFAVVARFS